MSTVDERVPLLSAPWPNTADPARPLIPLPGLHPQAVRDLESSYPGNLTTAMYSLLRTSCGLAGSGLGSIDFTSRWFPEEPLAVFRPCLTLAIDDQGRRWVAETSRQDGLPGPVWCIFTDPGVALFVCDDLSGLLATLRDNARHGRTEAWLRGLTAQARTVWAHRRKLALNSQSRCQTDRDIRGWLASIPFDAWVYDLRHPSPARGWPYGMVGADGQHYRCGQLPVFAVAGRFNPSRWSHYMAQVAATQELALPAAARRALEVC